MNLEVSYDKVFGRRAEAYQRLLEDAMEGDPRRFGRADALEEQWRIVDPVSGDTAPVSLYYKGTWGPSEADRLAADVGGWREPLAARRTSDIVMFAVIPYTTFPIIAIGPIELRTFGLMVGLGVLVGAWVAARYIEARTR